MVYHYEDNIYYQEFVPDVIYCHCGLYVIVF